MFEDSTILITGGTGSWGNELVRQLIPKNPREIRIFSRGELMQVNMDRKFSNNKLNFIIGDIRDFDAIDRATRGVDYIYHLAALKHVPVCEEQPQEAIKTNIVGTTNLINAAIDNKVRKVIDVSTDKAVNPLNLYGMTKAVGEKLIIQANKLSESTRFVCIRGGNVLGSNGSVVPYFIEQIKKSNTVTITDFKMTRFFLTLSEAIQLLFKASERSYGGETFVMHMPSYKIHDIAKVLVDAYGNNDTRVFEVGMRPGEKLHEVLISSEEANNAYVYDSNYYMILPTLHINGLNDFYRDMNLTKVPFFEYTSEYPLKSREHIIKMLRLGNFIDKSLFLDEVREVVKS